MRRPSPSPAPRLGPLAQTPRRARHLPRHRQSATTRSPRLALLLAAGLALFVLPGWECGEPLLEDPGFDLWCGKALCAWQVELGEIRRVPTWHRSDFGVELVGDPVVLSQRSSARSSDTTCLRLELQVERDEGVALRLELDFLDDGSVEHSEELSGDDWQAVAVQVQTPAWYDGVRFRVRKEGSGRAVLGHLRVTRGDSCMGPAPELEGRPDGAFCETSAQCKSGFCEGISTWAITAPEEAQSSAALRSCSSCHDDADCPPGQACGLEPSPHHQLYRSCGPAGRHQLGERCAGGAECATGICCESACSQCCAGEGCPEGTRCAHLDWKQLGQGQQSYQAHVLPWQCSPGEGLGVPGAPCLADADCQSGACLGGGELRTCAIDGRPCTSDDDCTSQLWPACLPLGTSGGTCQ